MKEIREEYSSEIAQVATSFLALFVKKAGNSFATSGFVEFIARGASVAVGSAIGALVKKEKLNEETTEGILGKAVDDFLKVFIDELQRQGFQLELREIPNPSDHIKLLEHRYSNQN